MTLYEFIEEFAKLPSKGWHLHPGYELKLWYDKDGSLYCPITAVHRQVNNESLPLCSYKKAVEKLELLDSVRERINQATLFPILRDSLHKTLREAFKTGKVPSEIRRVPQRS